MNTALNLTKDEVEALETLEALGPGPSPPEMDETLVASLEAKGLVARLNGTPEMTPEGRLKLDSHHLIAG